MLEAAGEQTFYNQKGSVSWNSTFVGDFVEQTNADEIEELQIPTTTLDQYVADNGIVPKLIKIDTEGSEIRVLLGAKETLRQHRPVLVMEFNPTAAENAGVSIQALLDLLHSMSYRVVVPRRRLNGDYTLEEPEPFDEQKHTRFDLANAVCIPQS